MHIDNLSPRLNQPLADILRDDCEIRYPFGFSLKGDKENKVVRSFIHSTGKDIYSGSFDWTNEGITEAYLHNVKVLFDDKKIEGFQVFDDANDTIGFETFEILDFQMAIDTIEKYGGNLVIIQHGDIEDPTYV